MADFNWQIIPELESDRLRLRCFGREDAKNLLEICSNPEVMRFAGDPPFSNQGHVRQMLANVFRRFTIREAIEWGIVEKRSDKLIGTCGLHSFDACQTEAEIGCLLGRQNWGHGFMQEALPLVVQFARNEMKLKTLFADVDELNSRSLRLFQRLGFRQRRTTIFELSLIASKMSEPHHTSAAE